MVGIMYNVCVLFWKFNTPSPALLWNNLKKEISAKNYDNTVIIMEKAVIRWKILYISWSKGLLNKEDEPKFAI